MSEPLQDWPGDRREIPRGDGPEPKMVVPHDDRSDAAWEPPRSPDDDGSDTVRERLERARNGR